MGRGGKQNKEFCFRHGDFEMAIIRILMEMLGRWVEIEVCNLEESSEVKVPACGWHPNHYLSSCS